MTDFIPMYGMVFAKLGIGLLAIILPITKLCTWWYYRCDYLESCH